MICVAQCNTLALEVIDMKTISVRLNTEEERVFTAYADIMGEPLSALFKRLIEVFFIKSSQLPSP